MSIELEYKKLEVEKVVDEIIGKIPENKLAKLMYYLECVFTVIESDTEKKYTNYNNYYSITKPDESIILGLVHTFNIKLMQDLNLFKVEPDYVPIDKENEFYEITDEKFNGKVNSEVIIEEKTRKVLKVMACKQSWIVKYYENPIKEYGLDEYNFYDGNNSNNDNECDKCKKCCCRNIKDIICMVIICVIIMTAIILFGILTEGNV